MARPAQWLLRGGCLLAGMLSTSTSLPAQAQDWRLTAAVTHVWFSSVVRDTTVAEPTYDLEPTTSFGLRLERQVSQFHVGIGVSYLGTHLRVHSAAISLADQEFTLTRWQVAALLTMPLLRVGANGAGLALAVGPAIAIWKPTDEDSRSRFAGDASLQFHAPVTPRWNLLATGGGTVSASPMNDDEVPDEFVKTTLWAWQAGLGLQYAF